MKNKVWHNVTISTEDQDVSICPNETFNGIILSTTEVGEANFISRLYLNRDEMELLILKMQEMMNYVLEK
jgi:hypothetical protein